MFLSEDFLRLRKNILWLNRLFLLFLSEKDEQKGTDKQHIRIEQLRHDFKCVDGFAQTGCGSDGNEHLCAVGQDTLKYTLKRPMAAKAGTRAAAFLLLMP